MNLSSYKYTVCATKIQKMIAQAKEAMKQMMATKIKARRYAKTKSYNQICDVSCYYQVIFLVELMSNTEAIPLVDSIYPSLHLQDYPHFCAIGYESTFFVQDLFLIIPAWKAKDEAIVQKTATHPNAVRSFGLSHSNHRGLAGRLSKNPDGC